MKNIDRRLDLSSKFMQMGNALMTEGHESSDLTIRQLGSLLVFMGGITFDDGDVQKFSELTSYFSAKKVLDSMEDSHNTIIDFLKQKSNNDTYEDMVKRIEELRKRNKEDNEDEDI
jgi:hypothetical protein